MALPRKRALVIGSAAAIALAAAITVLFWNKVPLQRPPSFVRTVCSSDNRYCLDLDVWQQGALGADYAEVHVRRADVRRRTHVASGEVYDVESAATWVEADRVELELRDASGRWQKRTFRVAEQEGSVLAVEE